jgi:hypothetical protein
MRDTMARPAFTIVAESSSVVASGGATPSRTIDSTISRWRLTKCNASRDPYDAPNTTTRLTPSA